MKHFWIQFWMSKRCAAVTSFEGDLKVTYFCVKMFEMYQQMSHLNSSSEIEYIDNEESFEK